LLWMWGEGWLLKKKTHWVLIVANDWNGK
jgi:hypothetical protein